MPKLLTNLVDALTRTNEFVMAGPPPPEGWAYRDFDGKLEPSVFGQFIQLCGPENLRALAMSEGAGWMRGQFFVNAEGQRRIADYLAKNQHRGHK